MNRISLVVLAAGALCLTVAGCGSDDAADASGLRKGTPTSSVSASATTTKPVSGAPTTPKAAASASMTCAQFKELDGDGEKQAIDQILAANPGSPFEGSPNVALGTAKLVCLAPGNADKTVAEAAGITP
ncbi:hypothetical protein AB0L62_07215 [Nocardia asteroides]|uniref:hypothetical protein n=1 Tax=Nocardia asteroides TaxID=1824 RepID=UPI0034303E40